MPTMPRSGIEPLLDLLDGLQQLAKPFESKEFALQRHQQRVGRRQRVERQQPERGRAIDEADVVAAMAAERAAQPGGALARR